MVSELSRSYRSVLTLNQTHPAQCDFIAAVVDREFQSSGSFPRPDPDPHQIAT
jgi:hypothetical protein